MVSRTFPATQCPRTMIFTDYAWPCCSHVHQPRHARARPPPVRRLCLLRKQSNGGCCALLESRFLSCTPRKYKEDPLRLASLGKPSSTFRAFDRASILCPSIDRIRTKFRVYFVSISKQNVSRVGLGFLLVIETKPWRISWKGCICYCGCSQCTVVLTRLRVIGRGNVG